MPQPWASGSKQIRIKSFKWDTVLPCRLGCKNNRGENKNCWLSLIWQQHNCAQLNSQIYFNVLLWPLIFLQPLDLEGCTVSHLKDLIHICLEPEAQGHGMTFNRFYVGSKYPYFISYRGKWVCVHISYDLLIKKENYPFLFNTQSWTFAVHYNDPNNHICIVTMLVEGAYLIQLLTLP